MQPQSKINSNILSLLLHVGSGKKLSVESVIMFQAKSNYTEILQKDGSSLTVSTNLGVIEQRLQVYGGFVRPNRKEIINLRFVEKSEDDNLFIKGHKVKISRRRKTETLRIIKSFMSHK